MKRFLTIALTVALAVITVPQVGATAAPNKNNVIIIAHRGASGHRPEHTLAAYQLAIEMGADFIEPDLVSTKDGQLVARHENEISGTTDVASHPEFASRKTTKVIDGAPVTGWFTEDFTLAELKTLRARERIPQFRPKGAAYDGRFQVPTFQEVIDLVKKEGAQRGRKIGLYPETKHPTYFDSISLSLEEPLVTMLHRNGYRDKDSRVFIQSFETANLKKLRRMTKLPLVQLLSDAGRPYDLAKAGDPRTYTDLATRTGLAEIATYAQGVGAHKNLVVPVGRDSRLLQPSRLVEEAHKVGLLVHVWTFRSENNFLPTDFRQGTPDARDFSKAHGDAAAEYKLFFRLGVDGVFTDFPDAAVAAREK